MAVDWLKIRNEYVTTRISLRKLAAKYGVSFSTISKKAVREKWNDERVDTGNKVATKVKQKVVSSVATQEADRITRLLAIGDKLAAKLDKATAELGEVYIVKRKTCRDEGGADGEGIRVEETQEVAIPGAAIVDAASVRNLSTALKNLRDVAQTGKADEDALSKIDKLLEGITDAAKR